MARKARGERRRPSSGWASLTPTEERIVELANTGLSNRQIADQLFVTSGTVKTYIAHVLRKVGASNRTELATAYHQRPAP